MDYHSQPLQFINRNYFLLKSHITIDPHYGVIVGMIYLMLALPISMLLAANSMFCAFENSSIFNTLLQYFTVKDEENRKLHKINNLLPLFLTSISINMTLLVFHIISVIKVISYGEEVLNSYDKENFKFAAIGTCSIYLVILLISLVGHFIHTWSSNHHMLTIVKMAIITTAVSIKINLIYILSYFVPYMLLAFIYNPLVTSINYFIVATTVFCGYLVWWGLTHTLNSLSCYHPLKHKLLHLQKESLCIGDGNEGNSNKNVTNVDGNKHYHIKIGISHFVCSCSRHTVHTCSYGMFSCATVFSTLYFLSVIIYILTLGSFNDFEAAHNLVVPVVVGLAGIFVGKPFYSCIQQRFRIKFGNNEENKEANKISYI